MVVKAYLDFVGGQVTCLVERERERELYVDEAIMEEQAKERSTHPGLL